MAIPRGKKNGVKYIQAILKLFIMSERYFHNSPMFQNKNSFSLEEPYSKSFLCLMYMVIVTLAEIKGSGNKTSN